MPSLLRPAGRVLLAAATAMLALAVAPALAQTPPQAPPPPAPGISVTVQPPDGGTPETISTADVPNGDMNTTYTVGSQRIVVKGGVSVYQLLDRANANFGYAEIEIPRPDGSTLRMSKDQVEAVKPAGFYTNAQGVTHFIGPTGSDGSVAPADHFVVSGAITLTQQRKPKLQVSIDPKRKKIDPGGSVQFEASVTGDEPGEILTYTWWLDGKDQRRGGPRFRQKFPSKDGVYELSVTVRVEGSEVSYTDVAKITVGDPKKGGEQTGSGDSADGGSTGGGTGGGGSGYDGSSYDSGSSYTPSYTPAPTPAPAPTPPPSPTPEPPDIPTSSGTTVEGNLLADVSDPPSNILESAARAAREGRQGDDDAGPDGAGVSEAALSIAGVLALLALGAGIETRQGHGLRWRRPQLRLPRRGA